MEITDRFRVSTPIDQTWKVLLDIERIAPCLPGAQLEEIHGDEFRGVVKVKVGPITAQYKGTARLAEVDEAARRIVIDASGRDTRGQGNASAKILVTMSGDDSGTDVSVHTDLSITGKVAQFGRGVLADVSAKLLGQFVERLEADVLTGDHAPVGEPAVPASPAPAESPAPTSNGAAPSATTTAAPAPATAQVDGPRRIVGPDVEPVDLLATAGAPVGRRLVPVVVGAVVAFLLFRWLRRRR
ncbi:MAG TPA: SRPBCC family protein [Acidimicrobiia bacterium]